MIKKRRTHSHSVAAAVEVFQEVAEAKRKPAAIPEWADFNKMEREIWDQYTSFRDISAFTQEHLETYVEFIHVQAELRYLTRAVRDAAAAGEFVIHVGAHDAPKPNPVFSMHNSLMKKKLALLTKLNIFEVPEKDNRAAKAREQLMRSAQQVIDEAAESSLLGI